MDQNRVSAPASQESNRNRFRGRAVATADVKGRLKIPVCFREILLREYGTKVFVTSLTGGDVRIYPFTVWLGIEDIITKNASTNQALSKFTLLTNYYGQEGEVDAQGRILIHNPLREEAKINGEVDVIGRAKYLTVCNSGILKAQVAESKLTVADLDELSKLGI